jgi:hypothetical protein
MDRAILEGICVGREGRLYLLGILCKGDSILQIILHDFCKSVKVAYLIGVHAICKIIAVSRS